MFEGELFTVGDYQLMDGCFYDRETHLWVARVGSRRARCGFDPLGSETSGDIVAVALEPVGREVEIGGAFGSLEAAKFVGPLIAPVSGRILARNETVLAEPSLLNRDPLIHWLVELELRDPESGLDHLLTGRDAVAEWFAAEIERFKEKGMVAE